MALLLAGIGCSAPPRPATPAARPAPVTGDPTRAYPLAAVFVLGDSGAPVPDTTVDVPRGEARIVVLRHAPPDNLTFATVAFPLRAFGPGTGDSVRVTLRPRRGTYGLDLETAVPLDSARITFKYAVGFKAQPEARQRYGSDFAFERVLAIGRLNPDGTIVFLPSTHPAADNLSAVVTGAGGYLVGAPR